MGSVPHRRRPLQHAQRTPQAHPFRVPDRRHARAALLAARSSALLAVLLLLGCGSRDKLFDGDGGLDGDGGTFVDSGWRQSVVDTERLARPWGKALGDVDGDGGPEALVGLFEGPIFWYALPGGERHKLGDDLGGDDLLLADIDGDGAGDAVTNGGSIAWYRNPRGTGGDPSGPWDLHVVAPGLKGHDLAVADLDGDGRADIVTRQENGPTTLFLQADGGDGWRRLDLDAARPGTGMALGDIDGDSRLDVVQNGYWLHQPASLDDPWPRRDFADWHPTSAVGVADLNGDGRGDIALAVGADQGEICWFANPGGTGNPGRWERRVLGQADYVHKLHLADMDGDGDLDLAFSEQLEARDPRVGVFYNQGSAASWELGVIAGRGAHNIAVDDVGGDGDLDILGADWREDTRLYLWENLRSD